MTKLTRGTETLEYFEDGTIIFDRGQKTQYQTALVWDDQGGRPGETLDDKINRSVARRVRWGWTVQQESLPCGHPGPADEDGWCPRCTRCAETEESRYKHAQVESEDI